MTQIWIVHRSERERAALERLAGEAEAIAGAPGEARFDAVPAAEVVVLGLAGDWEAELEFAHRQRARLSAAHWILVGEPEAAGTARALFDQLPVDFLPYPPTRAALRERISAARREARPSLSERALRDAVTGRFARWLADLELPDLLRATDPRLVELPLLVRGEPGTGRAALVRYVHQLAGQGGDRLVHVVCDAETGCDEIRRRLAREARPDRAQAPLWVWLDEVGRLGSRTQRELAAWLEAGAPAGLPVTRIRWAASLDAREPALEAALEATLGALVVELPPLRERKDLESLVRKTAAAWARQRRESRRTFDADALEALRAYPWPGNLRELESVLHATLSHGPEDPVGAAQLSFPGAEPAHASGNALVDELGLAAGDALANELGPAAGDALAPEPGEAEDEPLPASSVGVLLSDEPEPSEPRTFAPEPMPSEPRTLAPEPVPAAEPPRGAADDDWPRRLAGALSMQVRNPLATIRSFAELLPERFDDPEFRERFAEMLRDDVGRLHGLLGRVDQLGALDAPRRDKVDVAALLESLLDGRRDEFRARHLLVLKELDPGQSLALADPEHLRVAFEALLDKALSMIPERGDLYLASRRHTGNESAAPGTRVLFRFHDPSARDSRAPAEHSLELLIAELLMRAQGGRLTLGSSDAEERLLVVDLPAP